MNVDLNRGAVVRTDEAEVLQSPTDLVKLLFTDGGDVQVAEITSTDRVGPPVHTQEWHEVQYVVSGEVEFWLDGGWHALGPGGVQVLPAGTPHTVRVPEGEAKILFVSMGAPYDAFIREMVALDNDPDAPGSAKGEAATRHGVRSV
ncbi:MAG TPA: cupin domain-containing protein [Acidimicrobiales bacterium]|nr:cupin domain-containing protein [Acidimicrobiales bacterium]